LYNSKDRNNTSAIIINVINTSLLKTFKLNSWKNSRIDNGIKTTNDNKQIIYYWLTAQNAKVNIYIVWTMYIYYINVCITWYR